MPQLSSQLTSRVITAAILIGLLLIAHFGFGNIGMLVAVSALAVLAFAEYALLCFRDVKHRTSLRLTFIAAVIFLLFLHTFFDRLPILVFGAMSALIMSAALWWVRGEASNEKQLQSLSQMCVGLVYLGIFPGLGIRLLKYDETEHWFWYLVVVVTVGDIVAYFVGRSLGRQPLLKSVSPNKTLEGFVGAVVSAILLSFAFQQMYVPQAPTWLLLTVGVLVSFCAQTGDLFESLLKRVAGVKDSGRILPGHGGLLDRIDGHIFAAPIVYFSQSYILDRFL